MKITLFKPTIYLSLFFSLFIFFFAYSVTFAQIAPATQKQVVKDYKVDLAQYTVFGTDCSFKNKGDANCDGKVNQFDLAIWETEFNSPDNPGRADFNADGNVDLFDFGIWRVTFQPTTADAGTNSANFIASIFKAVWDKLNFTAHAQEAQPATTPLTSSSAFVSQSGNSFVSNVNGQNTQYVNMSGGATPVNSQFYDENGILTAEVEFSPETGTTVTATVDGVEVTTNRTAGGAIIEQYRQPNGAMIAVKSWPTAESYSKSEPPEAVTLPGRNNETFLTLSMQPNGTALYQEIDRNGTLLYHSALSPLGFYNSNSQSGARVESFDEAGIITLTMDNSLGGKTTYTFLDKVILSITQTDSNQNTWLATLNGSYDNWELIKVNSSPEERSFVADPIAELRSNTPPPEDLIRVWNHYSDPANASPAAVDFASGFNSNMPVLRTPMQVGNQIHQQTRTTPPDVLGLSIVKEAYAQQQPTQVEPGTTVTDRTGATQNPHDIATNLAGGDTGGWGTPTITTTGTQNTSTSGPDYSSVPYHAVFTRDPDGAGPQPATTLTIDFQVTTGAGAVDAPPVQFNGANINTAGQNPQSITPDPTDPSKPSQSIPNAPSSSSNGNPGTGQQAPAQPQQGSGNTTTTQAQTDAQNAIGKAGGVGNGQAVIDQIAQEGARNGWDADRLSGAINAAREAGVSIPQGTAVQDSIKNAYGTSEKPGIEGVQLPAGYRMGPNGPEKEVDGQTRSLGGLTNDGARAPASNPTGNPQGSAGTPPPSTTTGSFPSGSFPSPGSSAPTSFNGHAGTTKTEETATGTRVTSTYPGVATHTMEFGYDGSLIEQWSKADGTTVTSTGPVGGNTSISSISNSTEGWSIDVYNGVATIPDGWSAQDVANVLNQEIEAREAACGCDIQESFGVYTDPNTGNQTVSTSATQGMPSCFLAGTLISTQDGPVPIQQLKPGDKVWSYNEKTKRKEIADFVKLDINFVEEYLIINGKINASVYHPFYKVTEEGLVTLRADELKLGDILQTEEGMQIPVSSIERIPAPKTTVYNLMGVTPNNNFYAEGILVHNYPGPDNTDYGGGIDQSFDGSGTGDPGTSDAGPSESESEGDDGDGGSGDGSYDGGYDGSYDGGYGNDGNTHNGND